MCGDFMKVYDESEYAKCPYCSRKKKKQIHGIFCAKGTEIANQY